MKNAKSRMRKCGNEIHRRYPAFITFIIQIHELDAAILIVLKILAVLVLVLLNGFFVAAELALVRIRDTQLDALVAKGNRRAKMARHIVAHIDSYIERDAIRHHAGQHGPRLSVEPVFTSCWSRCLICSASITDMDSNTFRIGVGFIVLTFCSSSRANWCRKAAIRRTLPIALWTASPLNWFYLASYPFIWLLHRSSRFVLRRLGIFDGRDGHGAHSEEELRLVLGGGAKRGRRGATLILNALDLRHRIAREVMRPRQEITAFDTDATMAECLALAEKTRYSRFPICEDGDLDKTPASFTSRIFMRCATRRGRRRICCRLARKLIYVPETARLEKLLQLFLERKLHFAVRRGRIRRHARHRDVGKRAGSARRPDSGRV